jgi:ribonuclease Z
MVGREKRLRLYGPVGFIERVQSKLNAYTWNLVDRFVADLVFEVIEIIGGGNGRRAHFSLKNGFVRTAEQDFQLHDGIILEEESLRVVAVELEHRTPCLAFSLEESEHLNIWKNRLEDLGLSVGPWLRELKSAIRCGLPDETPINVMTKSSIQERRPLGLLREKTISISRGQKIAYVTDAAFTEANSKAIIRLAAGADILFIESMFAKADADKASDRAHLTTDQAGYLGRKAGVTRVVPFHFSPRYQGEEDRLLAEVEAAKMGR